MAKSLHRASRGLRLILSYQLTTNFYIKQGIVLMTACYSNQKSHNIHMLIGTAKCKNTQHSPLQCRVVPIDHLDIMDINFSQFQVNRELLLPINHVICYLIQVLVHTIICPVYLPLQVGPGRRGEG